MSVSFKTYLHAALTFAQPNSSETLSEDAAPNWASWEEFVTKEPSNSGFSSDDRKKVLQILAAPTYEISSEGLVNKTTGKVITNMDTVIKTLGTSPASSKEEFTGVDSILGNLVTTMTNNNRSENKFKQIAKILDPNKMKPYQKRASFASRIKRGKEQSRDTNLLTRDILQYRK